MHQYYSYEPPKPGRVSRRLLAQALINKYLGKDYSITKLRNAGKFTIPCVDSSRKWVSAEISFELIENYLFLHNKFSHKAFNLYEIESVWLDSSVEFALAQHLVGSDGDVVKIRLPMPFGDRFPLCPVIDREGVLYNSFQNSLAARIISLHHRLIAESHDFISHDWLYDLIAVISNCISIVDITLNQLYIKAEFDPLPGWEFNKQELGIRVNRRLKDKLHWIKQITGASPDNIGDELRALDVLRLLRNHTQHFDPPCFGFTLEEAAAWLDLVSVIGWLLFKLRKLIGADFNEQIVEMILLPKVVFHGDVLFNRERTKQEQSGYVTTRWNKDTDAEVY